MACNSCSSNINGIIFPDFVSNACCNPCCENQSVGGVSNGCGCNHNCGCNSCGCNHNCGCHNGCGNSNVSSGNCACSCGTGGCICTCD